MARRLPILLLRVPRNAHVAGKITIVKRNCARFLRGEWRGLVVSAQMALREAGEQAASPGPIAENEKQERQRRIEVAAEKVRKLNYSRAIIMLRSAGLFKDDSAVILQNLQALHPPEEPEIDNFPPPRSINAFQRHIQFRGWKVARASTLEVPGGNSCRSVGLGFARNVGCFQKR
jgi:hypothetical protein